MANNLDLSGMTPLGGFLLKSKEPLDTRTVVKEYVNLTELATNYHIYPGIIVYVESDEKHYKYTKEGTWEEFGEGNRDAQKNVQSDWEEIDASSDAFIKNKPNVVTQDNAIAGLYTIYGKRKLATDGEVYPEFEQGQECVFRGGYYPNDFKDFEKGDRRVVMYGKKGTFSVDMAEDRGDTPEDKHVVNRKFLADNYVPKLGYSQTVSGQEYQVYATQQGKPVRALDVHKGGIGNTIMMRDGSGTSSVKTPANWDWNDKDKLSANAEKIANVNMLTEYAVPKIGYTQGTDGQEYQVYATMSGNPTKVLDVHKGAVSNTILMRDNSGAGSINTPSNWKSNLSANAQKIVNVNMLTDYVSDYTPAPPKLYCYTVSVTGTLLKYDDYGNSSDRTLSLTFMFLGYTQVADTTIYKIETWNGLINMFIKRNIQCTNISALCKADSYDRIVCPGTPRWTVDPTGVGSALALEDCYIEGDTHSCTLYSNNAPNSVTVTCVSSAVIG